MPFAYLTNDCTQKLLTKNGGRRALDPLLVKCPIVLLKKHNLTSIISINNHLKSLGV